VHAVLTKRREREAGAYRASLDGKPSDGGGAGGELLTPPPSVLTRYVILDLSPVTHLDVPGARAPAPPRRRRRALPLAPLPRVPARTHTPLLFTAASRLAPAWHAAPAASAL
jgi:hypothetical protein